MMGTFTIYRSQKNRQWYWNYKSSNGFILADGGEGYVTRWNAKRGVKRFIKAVNSAEVIIKQK